MKCYLDSSAAVKALNDEEHAHAFRRWISATDAEIVSCELLETEMRRAALRTDVDQREVTTFLESVQIYNVSRKRYREAGTLLPVAMRSLDALHLASAVRIADVIVTYDDRLKAAAEAQGFDVFRPGIDPSPDQVADDGDELGSAQGRP